MNFEYRIDKDILPRTKEETKPHKFFGKIIDSIY